MSEYTPTTPEVASAYSMHQYGVLAYEGTQGRAEFDRWLNRIKADAWDEGHDDGQTNEHEFRPGRKITNPYREEAKP